MRICRAVRSLLFLPFATFAIPSASASNYDGRSWCQGPLTLVVDASGIEAAQPGAGPGLYAAIARAASDWNAAFGLDLLQVRPTPGPVADSQRSLGDGTSGLYFSQRISPYRGSERNSVTRERCGPAMASFKRRI